MCKYIWHGHFVVDKKIYVGDSLSIPLEIKQQMSLNHYASSSLTETLQNRRNIPFLCAAVLPRDRFIGNVVAFSFANPPGK